MIDLENSSTFGVDFSASPLLVDFGTLLKPTFNDSSFNGVLFTGSGFGQFNGLALAAGTNLAGFDLTRVVLGSDSLSLNFAGLTYESSSVVALDFSSTVTRGIPEPTTWAMMLVGF